MDEMYAVLDKGGLGIFESPTGTGKSLSIICSALQWLRDNEYNLDLDDAAALDDKPTDTTANKTNSTEEAAASATTASASAPPEVDWITAAYQKMQEKKRALELEEQKEKRLKQQKRLEKLQEAEPDHPNKKRKVAWLSGGKGAGGKAHHQQKPDLSFIDEMIRRSEEKEKRKQEGEGDGDGDGAHSDDEFCLAEYESEDEDERSPPDATARGGKDKKGDKSKREMLKGLYLDSQEDDEADGEGEEELHVRKLYYCSRTHSQLRQFVGEVKRTEFADRMRVVTLGSRKNLCVNAKVKKLSSVGAINDRCLDMQKQKTLVTEEENMFGKAKKSVVLSKCEWYEQSSQKLYRDHVLLKVRNIEELVQLGEKQRACPYYGTRAAVPSVEVVALPYNMLLHRATRESLGVDLKGNIVVVDEAHNLVDAINEMYSTQLTLRQLTQAESQLDQYRARYQNRLKAKNLSYIRQILVIVRAFVKLLQNPHAWPASASAGAAGAAVATTSSSLALPAFTHHATQESEEKTQISTSNDFLFATKIDNMNLFKIEKYIQRSEIVKKLNGFVEKYESSEVQVHISDDGEEIEVEGRSRPAMGAVEAFLLSLTNADADGRLLLSHNPRKVGESSLKFILLNPAKHFREVVAEARAVVLAGGTMHPIPDLVFQLFGPEAEVPEPIKPKLGSLRSFSCGHVISSESLLTLCVGSGPSDVPFDFAWQNRSSAAMIEELGRLVLNMCNIVPDGVVMFFPSYHYEQQVISTWETSGMLAKINARKKVLREPRAASMIGQVLEEYKDAIDANFTPTGAAASMSRQRGAILSAVVGGKMSEGINFSDGLGRCVVMVGLPYPNPRDPVLVEKMKYISAKAAAAASTSSSSASASSSPARRAMSAPVMSARQYYENACMRAVNQSIGRSIRHAGDYATILLVDHRYMRPEITSKLPRWIASTMPRNGVDASKPFTFGQAFGHTRAFFQNKRERQTAVENQRRAAREGNNYNPSK